MAANDINRVFILGAGVSKHCGYPLTNELLKEVVRELYSKGKEGSGAVYHIRNFVRVYYPHLDNLGYDLKDFERFKYPNIEDFMTLLDAAACMEYKWYREDAPEFMRQKILKTIYSLFYQKLQELKSDKAIYKFADCLRPSDAVISFNWDLNLEKALLDFNKKYSYRLDDNQNDAITLLKPHGSMNWFKYESNKDIQYHPDLTEPLNDTVMEKSVYLFKELREPNTFFYEPFPYIVPPTMMKNIDTDELKQVWIDSESALIGAKEINILGYSLPDYDTHTRYLLLNGLRLNEHIYPRNRNKRSVLIANPDCEVCNHYEKIYGNFIQFEKLNFEDLNFRELFM